MLTCAPTTKIIILISTISYVSSFFNGKIEHSSLSIVPRNHVVNKNVALFMSEKSDSVTIEDERNKLLSKASKLRKEVESLESSLGDNRNISSTIKYEKPLYFSDVSNSTWVLTYRFTEEPISDDDDNEKKPISYSGKMAVHFRSDGFTDLIPDIISDKDNTMVTFQKVWGWDVENSNEDGLNYLLFSADIFLNDKKKSDRFYFNARVDEESTSLSGRDKSVSLNDGIVTVKREIQTNSNGGKLFWGVFNGGGILAQFRKVGFVSCKATRI